MLLQYLAPKGRSDKRYGTLELVAKNLLRSIFYEQFGKQVPLTRTIIALHASRLSARNFSMPLHVSNPTEDIARARACGLARGNGIRFLLVFAILGSALHLGLTTRTEHIASQSGRG